VTWAVASLSFITLFGAKMRAIDVEKLLDNRPGTVPHDAILLSRSQLEEIIRGAAQESYERAARECEGMIGGTECAAAIRRLI
jgi:hypothetical protein